MISVKDAINTTEYPEPFDLLQTGIDLLQRMADQDNFPILIGGLFHTSSTTRFAVNQITQHTDFHTISYEVTLMSGKKHVFSRSTMIEEQGLAEFYKSMKKSLAIAKEIDFYQGFATPKTSQPVDLSGKRWSIEERVDSVIEAVNSAMSVDSNVIVAGTASENAIYGHYSSNQGLDVETSTTNNYFKVNSIVGKPDKRGYGQDELYWRFHAPDYADMAKEVTKTALDSVDVITLQPADYEVLLSPRAVANLVVFIQFGILATPYHDSNSYASDRLGDQIFDSKLTIENRPRDPKNVSTVFSIDGEGVESSNQQFIENGSLKTIPYNTFDAAKYLGDKELATGHVITGFTGNMSMLASGSIQSGNKSLDDQLSEVKDGLYVKEFWYNRFTIRREGGLTGLTRNGLYHVKNGEIQGSVRNLRYTESFVKAFGQDNIVSLSSDRQMFQTVTAPSIHLDKYHFSSIAHSKD